MEEHNRRRRSTNARCRYCGNERDRSADARETRELREQARTFQVIVACASCGAPFAALARN